MLILEVEGSDAVGSHIHRHKCVRGRSITSTGNDMQYTNTQNIYEATYLGH